MTMRLIASALLAATFASAQPAAERPFKIVTLDPALNAIIDPGAKLETLGDHFGLTEGPVWIQEGKSGHLLFSDCAANVIYKWAPVAALCISRKQRISGKRQSECRPANHFRRPRRHSPDRIEWAGTRFTRPLGDHRHGGSKRRSPVEGRNAHDARRSL